MADVMKSAGLTHGGFYGYFKSKDDLIAQALAEVLGPAAKPRADLAVYTERYLSPAHRNNVAGGCPVAALASETTRQPGSARAEMTAALKRAHRTSQSDCVGRGCGATSAPPRSAPGLPWSVP